MKYTDNGQGHLRKNLSGELEYLSFVPTPLRDIASLELSPEAVKLLSRCSRKIGELEGMLRFVPNADMYLAMYVRKEALLSAQIEGTQCTFDDILDPKNAELTKKDVSDVVAYVKATSYAVNRMKTLPLCTRLLKETHEVLLEGTRGQEKNPGQTRTSQNWIGPAGCSLKDASYIPPNVEDMADALSEMEKFVNSEHGADPIVKAALVHYQFETIHPFLDGNGRIGRLLITLSLMNDGVLSGAVFYPSYQLKLKRSEYYAKLSAVREGGTYGEWVEFFCACLIESAQDAIDALELLVALRNRNASLINERMGRSASNGQRLLSLLEGNPIVDVNFVSEKLDIARTTASNLVRAFCDLGILVQPESERQRYRAFVYEEYLSILRQGGEPL
ncbi:MAG: Fic family protein [Coriobacteriia bacterium]|nr:Fic family protein [Coriobacteriia bacterium]